MISPRLPHLPERVEIPLFFSPSRFGVLLKCKLSVLGESSAPTLLPPTPQALLGTLVHHVRREVSEGRWDDKLGRRAAAKSRLDKVTEQIEAQLVEDERTWAFVPLRQAIGRREWDIREGRLLRWISRMTLRGLGKPALPLHGLLERPVGGGPEKPLRVEAGDEVWLVAPSLRLRGRADRIEETIPGTFDIVDFKSGRLHDDEGRLLPEATLQVRLYALIAEELGSSSLRLFLEGDDRYQVPWDADIRKETRRQVDAMSNALPAGESLSGNALAEPGPHCRACRLRPTCGRYLEWAPTTWRHPRPRGAELPLDVWGTVESVTDGRFGHKVELRDASGRFAIIDGLDASRGIGALTPGETVYFFDLERTEDRKSHGRVAHPVNFHEHPPDGGRRLGRARGLQMFRNNPVAS